LTNDLIGLGESVTITNTTTDTEGTFYVVSTINGCESNPAEIMASGEDAYAEVAIHTPSPDEAFAGDDMFICENDTELSAYPVTIGDGSWSMMNPNGTTEVLNPEEQNTAVIDLAVGENTFIWSIESGACGITSQDAIVITYELDPLTENDDYTTPINTPVNHSMIINDEPNTEDFIIIQTSETSNGTVEIAQDGSFVYSPNEGYVGVDEFNYRICNVHCPDKCSESTVTITIGTDTECEAPEVITPNEDGKNDTFIIPCLENYEGSVMCVYNRWGDEVFHDENYKNDWAGTYKGENLPVGTYFYVLKVNDGNDTVVNGYIFIQR